MRRLLRILMDMAAQPRVVRVDGDNPPAFSCARCGWTPNCSGTPGPAAVGGHPPLARHPLGPMWLAPMKRHHVQLAWDGASKLSARCRCGWAGDRYAGDGSWWAAERDARTHEQAVRGAEGPTTTPRPHLKRRISYEPYA
jgi:hypothetical protein